jgi:salicylate hydroxylase
MLMIFWLRLTVLGALTILSEALSSPGTNRRSIHRVAVVGTGIAGLAVAHALSNSPSLQEQYGCGPMEVTLFDVRSELDLTAGAGIQLNGGLAVLGKINAQVQKAVREAGMPQARVRSRCKPWNSQNNSNNKDNNKFDTLLELNLKEVVEKAGGDIASSLIDENGRLVWISIMRGALQEALMNTLPTETKQRVHFGKNLIDIIPSSSDNGGVTCCFADGTNEGPFDLVVGCDGIKSACKEYIETGRISADASQREGASAAVYTGIRIRYAVQDGNPSEKGEETATLTQYFGEGAYALHGIYGAGPGRPHTRCAFLIYLDDDYIGPFKKKRDSSVASTVGENADWTQDVRKTVDVARQMMLQQTKTCGVPDLDIGPTIASADRFFELGVYFHNPFSFSGWSKEVEGSAGAYTVLCGDSAHALPPFLGQGSNQAVQDAYCLATKVYEYNAQIRRGGDSVNLKGLLQDYKNIRWPGTFAIFWKSFLIGYLETGGTNGIYAKFRDVFFKAMGKVGVAELVLLSAAIPKV